MKALLVHQRLEEAFAVFKSGKKLSKLSDADLQDALDKALVL